MSNKPFLGVVQFMHPGHEHKVGKDGWTPWNMTDHRRKFMLSSGNVIDETGKKDQQNFHFWGEWEAPSRSVYKWGKEEGLPENLVVPEFPGSAIQTLGLQNTDPYVFGENFKYTYCKQARKTGRTSFLADLAPGTLILFGSKIGGRFLLDTTFVVGENPISHSIMNWETQLGHMSDTYKSVTLEPMYWDPNIKPETQFKLYTGANHSAPLNNMYSFVPCISETVQPLRFIRPTIDIHGIVNHALMMGQKGTEMEIDEIRQVWNSVTEQVFAQGLSLGVSVKEPTRTEVPEQLWPH